MTVAVLRTGALAFFDSFAGLVPCKVTLVKVPREQKDKTAPGSQVRVDFTVTADRSPYTAGEKKTASALHVIPRLAVYVRDRQFRNSPVPSTGRLTVRRGH